MQTSITLCSYGTPMANPDVILSGFVTKLESSWLQLGVRLLTYLTDLITDK